MYSAEHFTIADSLFDAVVLSSSNDSTPTATHASSLAEEERRGHSSAEESVNHAVLELDDAASPATTNMGSDDGEESTTISSASFRDRKQRSTRPSAAIFDYLTRTTNSFSWLGVKSFDDQRVEDHFIAYMWCSRVKLLWGCMTVLCICLMFPFINGEIGTWSQYVYFSGALFCIALMILDAGSQKLRIRKERDDDEILRRIVDDGTAIAEQIETHTRIQREHHENFIKRCKTYEQLCFILMLSLGAIFLLTQYHHLKICAEKQFPDEKLTECYRATSSMYWGYVTLFRTLVHRTKLGIIILVVSVIEFLLGRVISPPVADSDRELWPKLIMIITYGASFLILQTFRERNSRRFFLLELSIVQSGRLAMLEKERIRTVVATMLPREVLHRVGGPRGSQRKADVRESASILQFDVVNFTRWCSSRDSAAVVQMVSRLVTRFDAEALLVGAHKLKTIGDAYQATTGLLGTHWSDGGSSAVGLFFLANRMHSVMQTSEFPEWTGRIGIATGQLMGTIVGSAPYRYDVFGEAAERVAQLEPDSAPEHTLLCAASDAQVVSVFPELGLRGERVHNGEELVGRMYGLCSDFCGDRQETHELTSDPEFYEDEQPTRRASPQNNAVVVAQPDRQYLRSNESTAFNSSFVSSFDGATPPPGSMFIGGDRESQGSRASSEQREQDDVTIARKPSTVPKTVRTSSTSPTTTSTTLRAESRERQSITSGLGSRGSVINTMNSIPAFDPTVSTSSEGGIAKLLHAMGTASNHSNAHSTIGSTTSRNSNDTTSVGSSSAGQTTQNSVAPVVNVGDGVSAKPFTREEERENDVSREEKRQAHIEGSALDDDDLFTLSFEENTTTVTSTSSAGTDNTQLFFSTALRNAVLEQQQHELMVVKENKRRKKQTVDVGDEEKDQDIHATQVRSLARSEATQNKPKKQEHRRNSAEEHEEVRHAEIDSVSVTPEEALAFQLQAGYGAGLFVFFMVFVFYMSCLVAMGFEGVLLSHINLAYALMLCSVITVAPIVVTHHHRRLFPILNISVLAITETIFHVACGLYQGALVSNSVSYSSTIFGVVLLYSSCGIPRGVQQGLQVLQTILQLFWQVYFYGTFAGSLLFMLCVGAVFVATFYFVAQEYHFHCLQSKRAAKSVELAEAEAEALEGVLMAIMPQHVVPDLLQRFHENSFAPIIQDLEGVGIGFFRIQRRQRLFSAATGDGTPRAAALERTKSAGVDAIRGIRRILFVVESVMPEFEHLMVVKTIGNVLMVGSCLSAEQQKHREDGLAQLLKLPVRLEHELNSSTKMKRNDQGSTHKQVTQHDDDPSANQLVLHCGVHFGTATTTVIGINQLNYDVYGTTVNGASRVLTVGCSGAHSDQSTVAVSEVAVHTSGTHAAWSDPFTITAKGLRELYVQRAPVAALKHIFK